MGALALFITLIGFLAGCTRPCLNIRAVGFVDLTDFPSSSDGFKDVGGVKPVSEVSGTSSLINVGEEDGMIASPTVDFGVVSVKTEDDVFLRNVIV